MATQSVTSTESVTQQSNSWILVISVKLTETHEKVPRKSFFLKKSFNSNSPNTQDERPLLLRGSSKNIWQGSFCSISRGTKRGRTELLHSNFSRLKTSLSGPESDWLCSQDYLFMVSVGRQDIEPSGSLILTQNYLMHVIFKHCTLQDTEGTNTFRLLNL